MNTFRCQVFPLFAVIDHSIRPEHGRNVLSVRVLPFLFVVSILADRNRGLGRVPGSPWNLSIRPTRSPSPPPTDLQLLRFPLPFVPAVSSTTVPSSNPLAPSILYRVSSFFVPPTSLASLLFISLFLFFPLLCVSVSLPFLIFFVTDLTSRIFHRLFLFLPDRHATDFSSDRLAKNHRDSPLLVLIQAFVPSAFPRENPAFFNKIPWERRWSVLLRTFFDGLMITKELS